MQGNTVWQIFFNKNTKSDSSVVSELALEGSTQSLAQPIQPEESSTSIEIENHNNSNTVNSLPECWSMQQYKNFKEKYEGLGICNKKLGCEYCAKYVWIIKLPFGISFGIVKIVIRT